ncbi:4'-phosphopantetheinyl transferase family protein [Streptomyces profundus]|uniref:4'-phosphopantetheinyl transferase family protein n=1 Tax=Streptomyces profundus TaxID=2867410 RepID=UPI001D16417F|nr:4'-phosphopantetheinyl transferase superfamily protein [Streptomyces sp. MA3_2.13]UED83206.1 4'-phosphopantetheinyl transferase superfamily protein [Streptomyces sp. MA3_2.13]
MGTGRGARVSAPVGPSHRPRLWWGSVSEGPEGPEGPREAAEAAGEAAAPPEERAADGAFTSRARRAQGAAARRVLGAALAELGLGDGPFTLGAAGAVRLVRFGGRRTGPAVQFSLAHTARQAVVALRRADGPPTGLGVDAEDDWDSAARNLHRFGTRAELALLAPDHAAALPLHLWCAKEAIAKATGRGFAVPPRRYRLHRAEDGAPGTVLLELAEEHHRGPPRTTRLRVGTHATRPPTAWAVAELPTHHFDPTAPQAPEAAERSGHR